MLQSGGRVERVISGTAEVRVIFCNWLGTTWAFVLLLFRVGRNKIREIRL